MPVRKILRLYLLAYVAGVLLTFLVAGYQDTLTLRAIADISVGVCAVIVLVGLSLLGGGSASGQTVEDRRASEDADALDNRGRGVILIAAGISWAVIANVAASLATQAAQRL